MSGNERRCGQGMMVVGPTASGKSALVERLLAKHWAFEAVGVDSGTIYQEMQIGTAGLSQAELVRGRYHLIGHVSVVEEYSLGQYLGDLSLVLEDLKVRGRVPLYVGGTALWVRAVLNNLVVPPSYRGMRLWLETRIRTHQDAESAARLLRVVDPGVPETFDPRNRRRLIRALEVALGSRGAHSVFGPDLVPGNDSGPRVLGLSLSRDALRERVRDRLQGQLADGWVQEVSRVFSLGPSRTARSAIGYAELWDYLEGKISLDEAQELIERRTMRLIRRQMAWFARDPRIVWVASSEEGEEVFERLVGEP